MGELFAGRYELVDPIGHGGVGAVWRSWDHRRRMYVAAKVLRQSDAHALLRFVREQALRIDHPHVVAPRSWAADDEQVLFTMELVCGGSLAHLVGDYGALPASYVCVLLDQLLSGLSAVHEEHVVHRDVKPANVLLEFTGTGRPHVRLSDFGIAMRKGEPRLTEADHVLGTPGYFAPEQLLGAEPDFPADLYAVGLVALFLLTGRKPDAQALIDRYEAHGGRPNAPQEIPAPLWEVLATLLHPDPELRFRTATGVRKALARAAELLPEPGPVEEPIEVFDQLGPLPPGYGPQGPLRPDPAAGERDDLADPDDPGAPEDGPEEPADGYRLAPPRPRTPPESPPTAPTGPPPLPLRPPEPPHPTAAGAPPTPPAAPAVPPGIPPHPATPPPIPLPIPPAGPLAVPLQGPPPPSAAALVPAPQPGASGPGAAREPASGGRATARRARAHAASRARRARRARPPLAVIAGMYAAAAVFLAVGVWALSAR